MCMSRSQPYQNIFLRQRLFHVNKGDIFSRRECLERFYLRLRKKQRLATRPAAKILFPAGSGTVVMSSDQLTSCPVPPCDKSARNSVHVPFGFSPSNELNIAVCCESAASKADGADSGEMFSPSGCHVPVNWPPELKLSGWFW